MSRKINKPNINQILNRVGTIIHSQKNEKIAGALSATPQTCSNWKTRKAIPWIELFNFAIKYDVKLDWLLTGKEHTPAKQSDEIKEIKQLKETLEIKEEILEIIRENAKLLKAENTRLKDENTRLEDENKTLEKNFLDGRRNNDPPSLNTAQLRKKAM